MRHQIRLEILALFLSFAVSSCTLPAGPPPTVNVSLPSGLTTIALPRITYGDQGPDPFCQSDSYDELHWQLKRILRQKGYRVVSAEIPPKENSNRPDPWASASAAELLKYLPKDAQAMLRVRVDRYLALDLCSKEAIRTLEMDASADLFVPGKSQPAWAATAKAGDTSMSRWENLPFRVNAELAGKLLHAFPDTHH